MGSSTKRIDYELDSKSIVIDVGGYDGLWIHVINSKYRPKLYVIEPVNKYYNLLTKSFKGIKNVKIFKFGLSDHKGTAEISVNGAGSSVYLQGGKIERIQLVDVNEFFQIHKLKDISLLKLNVEGAEYPILERMIAKNLVQCCDNIQIQFHIISKDSIKRMGKIRKELSITHKLTYSYPLVVENWKRK